MRVWWGVKDKGGVEAEDDVGARISSKRMPRGKVMKKKKQVGKMNGTQLHFSLNVPRAIFPSHFSFLLSLFFQSW